MPISFKVSCPRRNCGARQLGDMQQAHHGPDPMYLRLRHTTGRYIRHPKADLTVAFKKTPFSCSVKEKHPIATVVIIKLVYCAQ